MDSGHDPRRTHDNLSFSNLSARSRRLAITKDEQQRKETVPPPTDLELDILSEPLPPILIHGHLDGLLIMIISEV